MSITTEQLMLDAPTAHKWLTEFNYEDNRPVSRSRVELYTRQMLAGRWRMNGEAIIFDDSGMMLNGQHRCEAVVSAALKKADIKVPVLVVRGVLQGTYTTMDQGYARSGAQVMQMQGHKYCTARSAVCRAMFAWETSNYRSAQPTRKVMPDELLLVQDVYGDEVDPAVAYAHTTRKDVPIGAGLLGLAHIVFRRARPRKSEEFLEVLSTGLTSVAGHPALVFRSRVIRDRMRDRKLPSPALWSMLVRAWNHFDKGETCRNLGAKRSPSGDWVLQPIRGLPRSMERRLGES